MEPITKSPSALPPPPVAATPIASGERDVSETLRLASLLAPNEARFVDAMQTAARMTALRGPELERVASAVAACADLDRRLAIVDAYYAGPTPAVGAARRTEDRLLLFRTSEPTSAPRIVTRIATLEHALHAMTLERIGGLEDAPLVLRTGDHFAAVLDDYEEHLETNEIDLRELDDAGADAGGMVTVRGLVRAANLLLNRLGVATRWVPLGHDDDREVYVALEVSAAIDLARDGWLAEHDVEELMEFAGW